MDHATIDRDRSCESPAETIDTLIKELEKLQARHYSTLKAEGIERQVENLKHWLSVNRKNFYNEPKISETGDAWLAEVCDFLKLAAVEIQRLEGEGGIPATKEQAEKNEELLQTIRRLEKILHEHSAQHT